MRPRPTNTLATVALISGILSWTVVPFVAAVVAIICGHMARSQNRRTGEDGDTQAVIGLALGYVHLALSCLTIVLVVVIYGAMIAVWLGLAASGGAYR